MYREHNSTGRPDAYLDTSAPDLKMDDLPVISQKPETSGQSYKKHPLLSGSTLNRQDLVETLVGVAPPVTGPHTTQYVHMQDGGGGVEYSEQHPMQHDIHRVHHHHAPTGGDTVIELLPVVAPPMTNAVGLDLSVSDTSPYSVLASSQQNLMPVHMYQQ